MPRIVTGVLGTLLALVVSACGSGTSGSGTGASSAPNGSGTAGSGSASSSGAASADAVAWADKVCKSVASEVGQLSAGPTIDPSSPEAARNGLVSYLNKFGTALDRLIGGIKDAGTPPVADGQRLVDATTQALDQAKQAVQNARTKLAQVPVNDPEAAKRAFAEVAAEMEPLANLDSTKALEESQQLKDAFENAPTCKSLNPTVSSSPTPTS